MKFSAPYLRKIFLSAFFAAISSLGIAQQSVAAGNLNTVGTACVQFGVPPANARDLAPFIQGVRNLSMLFPVEVSCPVIRDFPDPATTQIVVFVDGDLPNGGTLACTMFSFDVSGVIRASKSFQSTSTHFGVPVSFTLAEAGGFTYMSLRCTLPPNAVLRGIMAGH